MESSNPLGKAIRDARRAARLTGEDMRRLAGIHPTSLSFIELGKREPSLEQLRNIAKALNVDPMTFAPAALVRRERRRGSKHPTENAA